MAISHILDKIIQYITLMAYYSLPVLPKSRLHLQRPVHQIITSGKNAAFFRARTGTKISLLHRIHQNTPLQVQKFIFFWTAPSLDFFPGGEGYPLLKPHPALPQTSLWAGLRPQNSTQIYATAGYTFHRRLTTLTIYTVSRKKRGSTFDIITLEKYARFL